MIQGCLIIKGPSLSSELFRQAILILERDYTGDRSKVYTFDDSGYTLRPFWSLDNRNVVVLMLLYTSARRTATYPLSLLGLSNGVTLEQRFRFTNWRDATKTFNKVRYSWQLAMRILSNIVGDRSTGKTLLAVEATNFAMLCPKDNIRYVEAEAAFDEDYGNVVGMPRSSPCRYNSYSQSFL